MPKPKRTKLFDTSGGAALVESLKEAARTTTQTGIYMGNSTLRGAPGKGNGMLAPAELAKIPKRNQSKNLSRVPPAVLKDMTKRTILESKEVHAKQSAKTQKRLNGLVQAREMGPNSHLTESNDDSGFGPCNEDYYDVPISDLADHHAHEEGRETPDPVDLRYLHVIETLEGPAVVHRRHRHNQSRKQKRQTRQLKWNLQEDILADTLLRWLAQNKFDPSNPTSTTDVDAPPSLPPLSTQYFTVSEICGLNWMRSDWPVQSIHSAYPAQSLIAAGLLSNAPDTPNWAVSIRTLETFRLLRLNKANFSVQAFVRAMCMGQGRTSFTSLQEKFADAFDLYLQLRRAIDMRIKKALGRDAPNWHIKNFCPACTHTVDGEEKLKYQFGYSIDGGTSAKRWRGAGAASDGHTYTHDYQLRLSREAVDVFKHVVKQRKVVKKVNGKGPRKRTRSDTNDDHECDSDEESITSQAEEDLELDEDMEVIDGEEYIVKNLQGYPTDESDPHAECVKNWKANAEDSKKGMFDCFDESGVFIGTCKHGILITYCDMVKSGELAKYPIAITNAIENEYPEVKKIEGYDIWCAFKKTLEKAGIIINGDGTTLAMHGYGHNRLCQLDYHPLYNIMTGIADFEQCERFFSAFNVLASVTRHSSTFHRHQWIDMFCRQSNAEKTENLGVFIYKNYHQSLEIIKELGNFVETTQTRYQLSDTDIEKMGADELEYIQSLKDGEAEEDNLRCLYVEALEKLWEYQALEEARLKARDGDDPALNIRTGSGRKRKSKKSLAAILADTDHYLERVQDLEVQLNVPERWTKTSPEYLSAKVYCHERAYHKAANTLRGQVIQRLMELQKCHMPNTNVKVRTNIAKHLQTRSKTIRSSVRKFNTAAKKIRKPTLSAKLVLDQSFLDDFYVLCDSRSDLHDKAWAKSHNRELRDKYHKLHGARYELKILNVENDRVRHWMRTESKVYSSLVTTLRASQQEDLASQVATNLEQHQRMCKVITYWLDKCEKLEGYTGKRHATSVTVVSEREEELMENNEDTEVLFAAVDELDRALGNMDLQG